MHECVTGWDNIAAELRRALAKRRTEKPIVVVDCYPGVDEVTVLNGLQSRLAAQLPIHAADAYHSPETIEQVIAPYLARASPAPGSSRRLSLVNFFDAEPLWRFRRTIDELKSGLVLIVGCGASLIAWGHILVYADLTRREARSRFGNSDKAEFDPSGKSLAANLKGHSAFLIDSCVADRWKRPLIKRWDFLLDTNRHGEPGLVDGPAVRRELHAVARHPFRLSRRPHQLTAEFCDCDPQANNDNGHLDDVLQENSLNLGFGDLRVEIPILNLVFNQPGALLGEAVYIRFGSEFPIRLNSLHESARFEPVGRGDGWREERAEVHDRTVVDMRRRSFSNVVTLDTHGTVNVLKLSDGDEAIVESPDDAFEPLVLRAADTIIVPAAVGRCEIRPHGPSAGKEISTIRAFVRI